MTSDTPEVPDALTRPFAEALAAGPVVLDGGMSNQLESAGHDLSDELWSARLLAERPEAITEAHLAYYEAGADVAITSSYQATFEGFAKRGIERQRAAEDERQVQGGEEPLVGVVPARHAVDLAVGVVVALAHDAAVQVGHHVLGLDLQARLRAGDADDRPLPHPHAVAEDHDLVQPGAQGGAAGEPVQRPERPQVGLLGEVVGDVLSAEVGEETPHVFLSGLDEVGEGSAIASPCFSSCLSCCCTSSMRSRASLSFLRSRATTSGLALATNFSLESFLRTPARNFS